MISLRTQSSVVLAALCSAGLFTLPAPAAVLVNLDATALPVGALPSWANGGTLAGTFTSAGTTVPSVATVTPGAGGGNAVKAVTFTGNATFYRSNAFNAPAGIAGAGQRSIEVWALNPSFAQEETLVAWGRRGGGDGTNLSFNYGSNGTYGSVGHWGAPDMGWGTGWGAAGGTTTGAPTANHWHHLVYTYNGSTAAVYANGVLQSSKNLTLATHSGFPFVIGGQNTDTGVPAGFEATLSIARVRVHDTALTQTAIRTQYNAEAPTFGKALIAIPPEVVTFTATPAEFLPGQPVTLTWNVTSNTAPGVLSVNNGVGTLPGLSGSLQVTPTATTTWTLTVTNGAGTATGTAAAYAKCQPLVLKHRWSFNEAAGTGTNGFALTDSAGGANAFIRTNGTANATRTGTQITLPGGASATAPYIDLPNGILSSRSGDATYEGWVTINGNQTWSRLFDFGSSFANGGAEILAPGGTGNGNEYLLLSAQIGGTQTQNRLELSEGGVSYASDPTVPYTAGVEFHFAVVYDSDGSATGGPRITYYRNGTATTSIDTPVKLRDVTDNNNWLGRSNWMADANLQGSWNEFRVYDGAMAADDVAASRTAGVGTVTQPLHVDLFTADKTTITQGDSATLHWKISGPGTITASVTPAPGTLPAASGSVNVSPAQTTTYVLSTGNGSQTRTSTFTLTVVDATPTVQNLNACSYQPGSVATVLAATDPRSLPLTYTIVTPPAHGTLSGTAPNLTYTPAAGYSGYDSFQWKVSNGTQESAVATVSIEVVADAPVAEAGAWTTGFQTAKAIRLNATDPNDEPVTFSIVNPPANGTLSAVNGRTVTYTPANGFSGTDTFTFKATDDGLDSNVATITVTVTPPPAAPTAVVASDSLVYTTDVNGSFVARLQATDVNANDTHTFTLVSGTGDTNNAWFTISGNQLISAHDFSGDLNTTVSVRVRVTDSSGASTEQILTFPVQARPQGVIINEINYNPARNEIQSEFVELHNPTAAAVDLSGWSFTSGINYTFPAGTTIPAGGYVVVAEFPSVISGMYGVTAFGPWTGGLSSDGEEIVLRDATAARVDSVLYGTNAPWPVSPNGDGPSLELIHPSLDNDRGSNWKPSTRAPGTANWLARSTAGWKYRNQASEASSPVTAWRQSSFVEDATWLNGTGPLRSSGNNALETGVATTGTTVTTLSTVNRTVHMRRSFTVSGTIPQSVLLRVLANDAAIVWINGEEVARFSVRGTGELSYNTNEFYENGNDPWRTIVIPNAPALFTQGTNLITIQAIAKPAQIRGEQDDAASYNIVDFAADAEIVTSTDVEPTPGAQNSVFSLTAAPAVRDVAHSPQQPVSTDAVTVTARVSDPQGVQSVMLQYQVVAPGSFIPAKLPLTPAQMVTLPTPARADNPAYETGWVSVPMTDAGGSVTGDTAGDGTYTAVIPAQAHRSLVRYRITVTDLGGATARIPYADDTSRNFAYFSYNGVPDYVNGTTYRSEDLTSVPTYHILMRPTDWTQMMGYNAADRPTVSGVENGINLALLIARRLENWDAALVYDGKVYDHISSRLRGGNSRYNGAGKRHLHINFNKGYEFEAKDEKGRAYPEKWDVLMVNKLFGNLGYTNYGLDYEVGARMWALQGVPMPESHWFQMRVITTAAEAPSVTTGDFFGLFQANEFADRQFMKARGMDGGNLYKLSDWIQQGEMASRYLAPGAPQWGEDFDNVRYNMHFRTTAADLNKYVDMENWYKFNAVQEAIRHYDIFVDPTGRHRLKNLIWWFRPVAGNPLGQCVFMPYDWDASFGPNWNNGWDVMHNSLYNRWTFPDSPTWITGADQNRDAERIAHRNAIREFRDLVFQPEPMNAMIDDAMYQISRIWQADKARWPVSGAPVEHPQGAPGKAQDMKNFCFGEWKGWTNSTNPSDGNQPYIAPGGRAAQLDLIDTTGFTTPNGSSIGGDGGAIPSKPVITYSGTANYPVDGLVFTTSAFADPQGAGTFGAVQWRIGEITDPTAPAYDPAADRIYEVTDIWRSAEIAPFAATVAVPAGAVRVGHTYRARVRHKDSTGRWSHWSSPLQFTATASQYADTLMENLIFSEIMYKPAPPSAAELAVPYAEADFEFVELKNLSTALTLDLSNVRFTKGVDYDFPAGTMLAPGARILVARNKTALLMRYPLLAPAAVIGEWTAGQSLANSGEQLKLSYGAGDAIHDITYDDAAPWPTEADNGGLSLVYIGPKPVAGQTDPQTIATNWRASYVPGGTPNGEELTAFAAWMTANSQTDANADPDANGYDNLSTFALALDRGAAQPASAFITQGADTFLTLTFTRPRGVTDVNYGYEISTDMAPLSWSSAGVTQDSVVINPDGTENVTVRVLAPVATRTRCFLRLRFSVIP